MIIIQLEATSEWLRRPGHKSRKKVVLCAAGKEPQGHLYQKGAEIRAGLRQKSPFSGLASNKPRTRTRFRHEGNKERHPIIFPRRGKKAVICSPQRERLINIQQLLYKQVTKYGGYRDSNFDSYANCFPSSITLHNILHKNLCFIPPQKSTESTLLLCKVGQQQLMYVLLKYTFTAFYAIRLEINESLSSAMMTMMGPS